MYTCLGKDTSAGGIFQASYESIVDWISHKTCNYIQNNNIKYGFLK